MNKYNKFILIVKRYSISTEKVAITRQNVKNKNWVLLYIANNFPIRGA